VEEAVAFCLALEDRKHLLLHSHSQLRLPLPRPTRTKKKKLWFSPTLATQTEFVCVRECVFTVARAHTHFVLFLFFLAVASVTASGTVPPVSSFPKHAMSGSTPTCVCVFVCV
jgi:hypothetical protein